MLGLSPDTVRDDPIQREWKNAERKLPVEGLWSPSSWQRVKFKPLSEKIAHVAWVFEQLANSVDVLNALLITVFLVIDDASFPSNAWVLLTLITLVLVSSFPSRLGTGIVFFELPVRDPNKSERRAVIGVYRLLFLIVRLSTIILDLLQISFASLPFECEIGSKTTAFCRNLTGTIGEAATRPAAAFVLSVSIGKSNIRQFSSSHHVFPQPKDRSHMFRSV